jgi:hypothetical protein
MESRTRITKISLSANPGTGPAGLMLLQVGDLEFSTAQAGIAEFRNYAG